LNAVAAEHYSAAALGARAEKKRHEIVEHLCLGPDAAVRERQAILLAERRPGEAVALGE
jgi:hypothetical protein